MVRLSPSLPIRPTPASPLKQVRVVGAAQMATPVKRTADWDRTSYLPAPGELTPPADAVKRGKAVFAITEAKSKAEALQVGAFFKANPSVGASQIVLFHSYWAQHQTFQKVPLQAYLYSQTRPVDEQGKPKNALWQAYADAVSTGAEPKVVENAFMRAHIAEFKAITKTPEFKQLYALSTPKYRRVVEAYLDTLAQSERELNQGGDATQTSRWLFTRTVMWLSKHKVRDNGFMATAQGLRDSLNVLSPLSRQIWSAVGTIAKSVLFNRPAERKDATQVVVSLSEGEAERLRRQTNIPFKAGRQVLTEAMLANARVSEPERREHANGAPKTYPLRMSDFLAKNEMDRDTARAGRDGVMNAAEITGVVQHVQGLVRSQLIEDFYRRYPVAHAGVHLYSANMLSMNGAYASSLMAHTLANAIMPVDNDGKPKNASWQAYADACDRRKATGSPSEEVCEKLWWKAHMEDFNIVDTPGFQKLLADFWPKAEKDPALQPLATYAKAMVIGRQNFEKDRQTRSEDAAFVTFIKHFSLTVAKAGEMPYWKEDLAAGLRALKGRGEPALDERGLPTEHTLFRRAVGGLKEMTGLTHTIGRGIGQIATGKGDRAVTTSMVDLSRVLTPAQLKQVDPRVVAFYKQPGSFDMQAGVDFKGGLSDVLLGKLAPAIAGQSQIDDKGRGFENYPMETELYKDDEGATHWDRYVIVDGERKPLFLANFEVEGRQIKETFNIHGKRIELYFDVVPHEGGVRLTLDRKKSSKLVMGSDIVFTVKPTPDALVTTGQFQGPAQAVGTTFTMRMAPKAA